MSEYLYGQESFQQERGANHRGTEIVFSQCLHSCSSRNVVLHLLSECGL